MPYADIFGLHDEGQHCSNCRKISFASTATKPQLIPHEPLTKEKLLALIEFARGDTKPPEKIITILPNGQIISYPAPKSIFERMDLRPRWPEPDLTNMYGDGI